MKLIKGHYYLIDNLDCGYVGMQRPLIGKYIGRVRHGQPHYLIEFIHKIPVGHNGRGHILTRKLRGKDGHCWYVYLDNIIEEVDKEKVILELL